MDVAVRRRFVLAVISLAAGVSCTLAAMTCMALLFYLGRGDYRPVDAIALLSMICAGYCCMPLGMIACICGTIEIVLRIPAHRRGARTRHLWMPVTGLISGVMPLLLYGITVFGQS